MTSSPPRRMRRKDASVYLDNKHGVKRTPGTLAKLACIGGGPVFQRDGRIPLYTEEWLDDYAESVLSPPMRSTSDIPPDPKPEPPDTGPNSKPLPEAA